MLRTVTIGAAFGCPFEGEVSPDTVLDLVIRCLEQPPDELAIADTIGVGVPAQVQALAVTPPRTQGGILEVVELASSALRVIHQAADSGGRGTAVRNNLVGFARGAYDELLRGAGPFEHGGFGGPIVARNAVALSGRTASAAVNDPSASSHSPRRSWTRPIRCSIPAISVAEASAAAAS